MEVFKQEEHVKKYKEEFPNYDFRYTNVVEIMIDGEWRYLEPIKGYNPKRDKLYDIDMTPYPYYNKLLSMGESYLRPKKRMTIGETDKNTKKELRREYFIYAWDNYRIILDERNEYQRRRNNNSAKIKYRNKKSIED